MSCRRPAETSSRAALPGETERDRSPSCADPVVDAPSSADGVAVAARRRSAAVGRDHDIRP